MITVVYTIYNTREKVKLHFLTCPQEDRFDEFMYAHSFKTNYGSFGGSHIRGYPQTEEFLDFSIHNIPARISRGLDPYNFICARDGKTKKIRRDLYFVMFEDELLYNKSIQFVKCTDAINYVFAKYKEHLTVELQRINSMEC